MDNLEAENRRLAKRVAELEERLAKYETPKNSRNSSVPPSRDENRPKRNQSLRKKSGKRPGGQAGRKGKTLEMVKEPDHVEEIVPKYCKACGAGLSGRAPYLEGRRQVVDIPPIRAEVTEYRTYSRKCGCGHCTVPDFPQGVVSPIGYGPNAESLASYLHARQYLPYKRMAEMFADVLGVGISEGGIGLLLERFAQKARPVYQEIRQRVQASTVVGSDETGAKVNGKRNWFWTWQTPGLTYIAHSPTRGKAAVEANFPDGLPNSVLVHDCWNPQRSTKAKAHQICLPHLLRDIAYLKERFPSRKWPKDFESILADAMALSEEGPPGPTATAQVENRLRKLLERPPDRACKELYAFYKRVLKERGNLFTFLHYNGVPFDNNGSERAVRNIKVKQKISGQFKTEKGAQGFAMIRSVIDTTMKNGQNVLEALSLIAKLQPQTLG